MAESSSNRNDRLVAMAAALVGQAEEKGIRLRVVGGTAINMACPGIAAHPSLQRPLKDIDLAMSKLDLARLPGIAAGLGLTAKRTDKPPFTFEKEGIEIEVFPADYVEGHRIDLTSRLAFAGSTVPLADLLLIKLQRSPLQEKDIQDAIALLLDHPAGRGEAPGQIDCEYIARLGARDWGLFTAVYDNTVLLEKVVDRYLELEQQRKVWQQIELIQGEMDRQPKSVVWMLQQVIRRPTQVPT